MAETKNVYEEISSANLEYRSAITRNAGISGAKERVKNLLFNHLDDILRALQNESLLQRDIELLKEQRTMLEDELEAMDAENDDMRKKIKELEEGATPKRKKTKTMTAVVE